MCGLRGKKVMVTGGGAASGRAICRRFADEGSLIGVFDINGPAVTQTAEPLRQAGGQALARIVDITDCAAAEQAVATFKATA